MIFAPVINPVFGAVIEAVFGAAQGEALWTPAFAWPLPNYMVASTITVAGLDADITPLTVQVLNGATSVTSSNTGVATAGPVSAGSFTLTLVADGTTTLTAGAVQQPISVGDYLIADSDGQVVVDANNFALYEENFIPAPPLSGVSAAVAAAYGLRRMRSDYTGPAVRVRRSSDNAEADIGFDGFGRLDTAALLAHCGSSSGFVRTWYDQSGNGRNAVQAAAASQPRIVNAGVVDTAGTAPAVVFDGSNDGLVTASWGAVAQPFTRSMVIRTPSTIVVPTHISNSAAGSPNTAEFYNSTTTAQMFASLNGPQQTVAANERVVFTSIYNGASSVLVKNGTASAVANPGAQGFDGIRLAGFQGATAFSATAFQEFVAFQSVLSTADRQSLERNQGIYFGIAVA